MSKETFHFSLASKLAPLFTIHYSLFTFLFGKANYFSLFTFHFITLLVATLLTGCATRKVMTRDTLYQSNVHYDSIYIDNWQYVEHRADTVFTEKVKREYKYKLLRDTIYRVHTDTIPIVQEVETVREVKYTPWYTKSLACTGAIVIFIIIVIISIKTWKIFS